MKKRFKPLLFIICMVSITAMLYTMCSNAGSSKTTYVALGDSIAAGYGLIGYSDSQEIPPKDSYQSAIGRFLKTEPVNLAVTGADSTDCINILNSGKADEALSDAGIITISIGSNDLLKPFVEIAKETFGITGTDGSMDTSALEDYYADFKDASLIDMLAIANDFADKLKDNKVLNEKAQGFASNFNEIIDILKEKAPQAEIYVTNIYNPYKDVMVLGSSVDAYIKQINNAFTDNQDSYTLIDAYTLFAKENLVNTKFDISDLNNINLDPHPSKEGHLRIAKAILEELNAKHAPAEVKTGNVKSTAKNTVTIKLSCSTGKSGYEIEFASSKDGKWKKLQDTSKNKNQVKSSKLKSGKTYYFRARAYNNLNGVKYYSGYSQVKKAKIK